MKIAVIGAGNMGGALIHGWAKSGKVESLTIADKNEALLDKFRKTYPGINATTDNTAAVKGAEIVVLVVKPWLMPLVLDEIKPSLNLDSQIIVSDAALIRRMPAAISVQTTHPRSWLSNSAQQGSSSMPFQTSQPNLAQA